MFRPASLVLLLLMAGCASPAPDADAAADAASRPEGWAVTATRVEPVPHAIHWTGQLAARPCAVDGTEACRGPAVVQSSVAAGISWDEPDLRLRDGEALFWRVATRLSWWSQNPLAPGLELDVVALPTCVDCPARVVTTYSGPSPIVVEPSDVFLRDGEDGVALVVRASDAAAMETSWGVAAVRFAVDGVVTGYHPAGDPIRLA